MAIAAFQFGQLLRQIPFAQLAPYSHGAFKSGKEIKRAQ